MQQQTQKSSSVSSFSHLVNGTTNNHNNGNLASTSTSAPFSTRGQQQSALLQNSAGSGVHSAPQQLLFPQSTGNGGASAGGYSSGLGHSSSSSILSQNSLGLAGSSNSDDKAYTQNALKQIRNSLQPFATKHPNGGSALDRRPSSASSNASSSNSIPVAGAANSFGQLLLLQQASSAAVAAANNNGNVSSYLYSPASQPTGSYQYGQVNKMPTSASSTQISLNSMPSVLNQPHLHHNFLHNGGGAFRSTCDNSVAAAATPSPLSNGIKFDEHQRKLIKTLLELGLPEVN